MTLPLVATGVNLGTALAIAAVAIGLTVRIGVLVRGGRRIFPHH